MARGPFSLLLSTLCNGEGGKQEEQKLPTLHSQAGRSLGEPPSQLPPTVAFASSFYIHPLLPLPASLSRSLLLNKLNLVSTLFSCPPESTSITPTEHWFTAETLAPTGTPDLVTPPLPY